MNPAAILQGWRDNPDRDGDLVHVRTVPPRPAEHAGIDLHPLLAARLAERGIHQVYRHQAEAVALIRDGRHVVLAAGTAAGKSLSFQIPILEAVAADPKTTALLIYPTKALAQDQASSLRRYHLPGANPSIYDGDTPTAERADIRRRSNLILTNPDMLHIGILPNHTLWSDFFHRLAFVVVDEVHNLRGIFGTHVAMILRRLRRIAAHYGGAPVLILSSATIGNPADLGHRLTGLELAVVDANHSPMGERTFALWNPPLLDDESGRRRSALGEASELFSDLVAAGWRTIAFTRGRKATELMFKWSAARLPAELAGRVAPYRAGYTPGQRRQVERRLFDGDLAGVVATNALELGIDVGGLDAAVITTFPGTLSAFRQQSGRAGRSQQQSLTVLVAGEDALDQYLLRHPDELFGRPSESVVINPDNPLVAEAHAACAAYELPLGLDDREVLGNSIEEAANRLVQAGHLRLKDGRLFWIRRTRPAPAIDLRGSGGPTYVITDGHETVGSLDQSRVNRDAHVGAVYLHQGDSYLVRSVDHELRQVIVTAAAVDYYTQTRSDTDLAIVEAETTVALGARCHISLGKLEVESRVISFQRRRLGTREVIATIDLDLPPSVMTTAGIWITLPDELVSSLRLGPDLLGALHAAEHAGIALLPLMAVCDRWDIGGLSTNWHPDTGTATIFIYEGYPGGAGISPIAFERHHRHWQATVEAIRDCPCASGCPSCIQSPKCGNLNEPLSKHGALTLLQNVLA
ncbi:MAG: DEAD/DEAH box helicase [Actinomycetota bacterium]